LRLTVDKIASITRNLGLSKSLTLSEEMEVRPGSVLVGKVKNDKHTYSNIEDVHGRMTTLHSGDLVVGALGHRNALQGYEGVMPTSVVPGQTLNLLNMGGVMGECISYSPEVGPPFEVQILGQVLTFPDFQSRIGKPANIDQRALPEATTVADIPVIYIAGTCMNSGKTAAACALVRKLSKLGFRVGAAKLTGVSLIRDILAMRDYGAEWGYDFTDAGVPASNATTSQDSARRIFRALKEKGAEIIVAETGDGIMGEYGVQAILSDADLMKNNAALILCANDPVGVAGGVHSLRNDFHLTVDLVAGPATDNQVGNRFVEQNFGIPAVNARIHPDPFANVILNLVRERWPSVRR
jgi:hypothetical protein